MFNTTKIAREYARTEHLKSGFILIYADYKEKSPRMFIDFIEAAADFLVSRTSDSKSEREKLKKQAVLRIEDG
jgi:hypothetical protein